MVAKKSWIEEPSMLEQTFSSCETHMASDRALSRFMLQLRYARPTNVGMYSPLTSNSMATLDAFLSITKQMGYNTFMEVTDACTADVCGELRPRVIPVAAKPDIERMCTLLNRLQDGVLQTCNFLAEASSAWDDSYCCPCGFVLFETEPSTNEIRCHRLDPLHVFWLRAEGREPLHLYIEEAVSREVLIERYPRFEEQIMRASPWFPPTVLGVDPPMGDSPDTIKLLRAYRRRSGDKKGHVTIAIDGGKTVLNGTRGQPWPYDFFPVSVFRNRWDHKSFGGVPLGRYIVPHHLAVNRLARIAEDSFKGAVPYLLSHADSGANEVSDVPFHPVKWTGAIPPQVVANNPVSEQLLKRIDYHDSKAYAQAGINKQMAQGLKPAGINSGVALRELKQLADARKAELYKRWEEGYRQAGHIIVALANELKKVKVAPSADANAELMSEINVAQIKLDKNDYRISYGITSALSKTIPGLLEDLGELKNLGYIDTADMAEAIGTKIPDVQSAMDRATATRRLAAKQVQLAIDTGQIPIPPSVGQGQQGLDDIAILGQRAWCQAMINPEKHSPQQFEALRRLMKLAQSKKGQPLPPPQTVQPAQPMAPDAVVPAGVPAAPEAGMPPQEG